MILQFQKAAIKCGFVGGFLDLGDEHYQRKCLFNRRLAVFVASEQSALLQQ